MRMINRENLRYSLENLYIDIFVVVILSYIDIFVVVILSMWKKGKPLSNFFYLKRMGIPFARVFDLIQFNYGQYRVPTGCPGFKHTNEINMDTNRFQS